MITGFNTDVKYDGVTYHVQTEDKGLDTPLILSLVYENGTILASKRSSYEDMVGAYFDESALEQKLQRQHKLMCAAVQSGRIEDLKRMTVQNAADAKAKKSGVAVAVADIPEAIEKPIIKPLDIPLFEPTAPDAALPEILKSKKGKGELKRTRGCSRTRIGSTRKAGTCLGHSDNGGY